MAKIVIEEPRSQERLAEILAPDRIRAAYQIGVLVPEYFEHARCFWAIQDAPRAIVTVYEGMSAPAIFTWGDPVLLKLLVSRIHRQLPNQVLLHLYPEHAEAFNGVMHPRSSRRVFRMSLTPERFRPVSPKAHVEQLSHRDTAGIQHLYGFYPDSFFEPYQLETGYYFGVKMNGVLASVAGIHFIHEKSSFAMLGNIVTAPSAQGLGYSRACTSKLCTELFRTCELLVLDVPMGGMAAARVFADLGFKSEFYYEQALSDRDKGFSAPGYAVESRVGSDWN